MYIVYCTHTQYCIVIIHNRLFVYFRCCPGESNELIRVSLSQLSGRTKRGGGEEKTDLFGEWRWLKK